MFEKINLVSRQEAATHFETIAPIFAKADEALVFTDPPFFTGKVFMWDAARIGLPSLAYYDRSVSYQEQVDFHLAWLKGYVESGKPLRFAIFADMQSEAALRAACAMLGTPLRAEIILREQGRGEIRRQYRKGFFFEHVKLLVFSCAPIESPKTVPEEFLDATDVGSVWTKANSRGYKSGYPTEKSHEVASTVVRWLAPKQDTLVIDPFAGSGALVRAARRLGHPTIALDRSQAAIDYIEQNP